MRIDAGAGLAEGIRSRRKELGLTQQELADLSGVSSRTIFELENRGDSITFARLMQILAALGLQINLEARDVVI